MQRRLALLYVNTLQHHTVQLLNVYMTVCLGLLGRSWIASQVCQRNSVKDVNIDKDTIEGHFKALNSMWQ